MTEHQMNTGQILIGDALETLRTLPDGSVHCCVTSPPYWGLRDYGTASWEGGDAGCDHKSAKKKTRYDYSLASSPIQDGKRTGTDAAIGSWMDQCSTCGARRIDAQLGLEPTPEAFVAKMVEIFAEVRRVLRDDGTLWLNLGDSYAANGISGLDIQGDTSTVGKANPRSHHKKVVPPGLKPKDLCGIPWRVALALQADGWYLRSDIIWSKPNPMPESVTDRPTKAHEYIFLLTKRPRYYYDAEAIREDGSGRDWLAAGGNLVGAGTHKCNDGYRDNKAGRSSEGERYGRNKRTVWTVATRPFKGAHFATFSPKLIEPCILAGVPERCCAECGAPWERVVKRTSEIDTSAKGSRFDKGKTGGRDGGDRTQPGERFITRTTGHRPTCKCNGATTAGTVLDPFGGAGTTGLVAKWNRRHYILIELNPEYADMARERIATETDIEPEAIVAGQSVKQLDMLGEAV